MKLFKRIVLSLLVLSAIYVVMMLILVVFTGMVDMEGIFAKIFIISAIIVLITGTVSLFVFIKNIDIALLILIGVALLGFFFRRNLISGGVELSTLGLGLSCIFFVILAVKSIVSIKGNRYLSVLVFFCSITLLMCYAGTMYFQYFADALISKYAVIPYFIVSIAIIFSLPNSKFIDWSKSHKRILLRAIFIPWIFMFIITSMQLLLPSEVSESVFFKKDTTIEIPWMMVDYELEPREGLE